MKTILVAIGSYLPGERSGGPARSTANMIESLGDDFCFYVLTADRDFDAKSPYTNIIYGDWNPVGKGLVRYLSLDEMRLGALRHILNHIDYDVLYIDSVFATLSVKLLLLRRLGLIPQRPTILVTRGNLHIGAIKLKFWKKRVYLTAARILGLYKNLIWHASSEYEKQRVLRSFGDQIVDIQSNLPSPQLEKMAQLVGEVVSKTPHKLRMIFLSRIAREKNLRFALEILKSVPGLAARQAAIEFDIYGYMEDVAYWRECQQTIAQLPTGVQVTYKGEAKSEEVVTIFASYHLFSFPTLGENFGHVILESLCAGCPVLTTDRTPWDELASAGAGFYLSLEQPDKFVEAIQQMLDMDDASWQQMAQNARRLGVSFLEQRDRVNALREAFISLAESGTIPEPQTLEVDGDA